MVLNKETLEIPLLEDIIAEHETNFKPILGMNASERIAVESVAGQIIQNTAKSDYEMFLSMQIMMASLNPNTAQGRNLDLIAIMRGLNRIPNESDDSLRKRITGFNKQTQNFVKKDLLLTQLENIAGVTKANVIYKNGEIWAIVSGGNNEDIARVMRDYAPIGVHRGNTTVSIDCINFRITRAVERVIEMVITVNTSDDSCICSTENTSKIAELVLTKSCDYTAGSAIKESHIKNMLGKEGFNVDSVYFKVKDGKVLTWDGTENAVAQDPCNAPTAVANEGGWDEACWDTPCPATEGRNILLPNTVLPVFCQNAILVKS